MKKMALTILVLLALTLAGCGTPTQEQIDASVSAMAVEFNYKGHHYISFRDGYNNNSVGGISHAPTARAIRIV